MGGIVARDFREDVTTGTDARPGIQADQDVNNSKRCETEQGNRFDIDTMARLGILRENSYQFF